MSTSRDTRTEVTETLPDDPEEIAKAEATLTFFGEAWIDDRAVRTDYSEGYTVPLEDLRRDGEWLIHGTTTSHHVADMLRGHENAPEKASNWQGPFTIKLKTWGI